MLALKRISKDIQEITQNPIEGIGLVQYENDFLKYIVNIKLMSGVYKGFCLQLLLTFTESYPTNPPKILIFPGQNFNGSYHHHVFSASEGFYKFCFDLLENDFMNTNEEKTGWNPSYTISSLLIQVQNFLCDPDLHHEIPKYLIDDFFSSMKNYSREFKDAEGKIVIHTWDNPYPKMFLKETENKDKKDGEKEEKKETNEKDEDNAAKKKEEEEKKKLIEIKENLTCFMLKLNYIEDPEILLGYPIIQKNTGLGLKTKIELYPIPELLTYDGFIAQVGKKDEKLDFYFDISFKSANNEFYNYWVPIYIDQNHFEKNKETILNSFSIIKYGAIGLKEYDFKTDYIFEILPIILNKMIIGIFNKKTSLSEAFIRCYFQYILLLKKLTELYKKEFDEYLNNILTKIKNNYNHIDKKIIPDIGNFMVLLLFSNFEISDELWSCLIDESSIRQMYWMFHGEENVNEVKKIISESPSIGSSRLYKRTHEEIVNDMVRANRRGELKINDAKQFKLCLKEKNIYDDILSIIINDKNIFKFPEFKKHVEAPKSLQNPFAKLTGDLTKSTNEDKLDENFEEKINDYLEVLSKDSLEEIFKIELQNISFEDLKKIYPLEKMNEIEKCDYDKSYVDKILKDIKEENIKKKLLKQFYDNQKGNKLLIISYLARKKIKTPGFMEELEKNYGVLLNCHEFMKEIKSTIESINSYADLYKFVNCDLIGDQTEYDFIIRKYFIAKKKRYIKSYYNRNYKLQRNKYFNKDKNKDNDEYNDSEDQDNDDLENEEEEKEKEKEEEGEWETVGKKKSNDNYYYNNDYHYNNQNYRGNNYHRGGRGRGRGRGGWRGNKRGNNKYK